MDARQPTPPIDRPLSVAHTDHPYGPHPSQFVRVHHLLQPSRLGHPPPPVALIVHGGWWKNRYTVANTPTASLPASLAAAGFTPIEVEYRRRDDPGGTAPGPAADVAAAVTLVASTLCPGAEHGLWVGHSAGGTLVLDAAVRVAAALRLSPLVVGLAAVTDLAAAAADGLGDGHDEVERYLGVPAGGDGWAAAVAMASPVVWGFRYPPARQLLVAGAADVDVPARYVDHYTTAVGGGVHTLVLPDVDHYQLVEGGGRPGRWSSPNARSCWANAGQGGLNTGLTRHVERGGNLQTRASEPTTGDIPNGSTSRSSASIRAGNDTRET
ncbi:hypothetical protein MMPV_005250 [Pyropia vietnamensis]